MVINVEENFSSTGYPGILLCISASTTAQYTGSPLKKVTVYYGISPYHQITQIVLHIFSYLMTVNTNSLF